MSRIGKNLWSEVARQVPTAGHRTLVTVDFSGHVSVGHLWMQLYLSFPFLCFGCHFLVRRGRAHRWPHTIDLDISPHLGVSLICFAGILRGVSPKKRRSRGHTRKCHKIDSPCLVALLWVPYLPLFFFKLWNISSLYHRTPESHHGNSHRCVMPRMRSDQAHQPVIMGFAPGVNRTPDTLPSAFWRLAFFLLATRNGLHERRERNF